MGAVFGWLLVVLLLFIALAIVYGDNQWPDDF